MTRNFGPVNSSILPLAIISVATLFLVSCNGAANSSTNHFPTDSDHLNNDAAPSLDLDRRRIGDIDGVSFIIASGSKATFTVNEQLAKFELPIDAVVSNKFISGNVHLDGRVSVIEIDLQKMDSGNRFRDRYIRSRMFGAGPTAVFTLKDIGSPPPGLDIGEEITAIVEGELFIKGKLIPLQFDITAQDKGDFVQILGKTSFTWKQIGIQKPTARSVISVEDEVKTEVLLLLTPKPAGSR